MSWVVHYLEEKKECVWLYKAHAPCILLFSFFFFCYFTSTTPILYDDDKSSSIVYMSKRNGNVK